MVLISYGNWEYVENRFYYGKKTELWLSSIMAEIAPFVTTRFWVKPSNISTMA